MPNDEDVAGEMGRDTGRALRELIEGSGLEPKTQAALASAVRVVCELHSALITGAPLEEAAAVDRLFLRICMVFGERGQVMVDQLDPPEA